MTEETGHKPDIGNRVRLHDLSTLSDNHYVLRKAHFDFRRNFIDPFVLLFLRSANKAFSLFSQTIDLEDD